MGFWDFLTGRIAPPVPVAAAVAEPVPVQEAVVGGYDPDLTLSATGGGSAYFRKLTAQADRDLEPMTQERAQSISFHLYDSNMLAKRILDQTADFVLGEGVEVLANASPDAEAETKARNVTEPSMMEAEAESDDGDPERDVLQAVIDRHWTDPINRWPLKVWNKVMELGLYGEQFYSAHVNEVDGRVRLGYIDPAVVIDVIPDPENAEVQVAVCVRADVGDRRYYRVIHLDEDPTSDTFGRMVGAQKGETITVSHGAIVGDGEAVPYVGSCFVFQVNKVSNARRGRPDLLAAADWLDGYDQFLFNEVDRHILMKTFVWDVLVRGGTDKQIDEYLRKNGPPKPGSVRGHNEQIEWTAVTPDLKSQDASVGADLILSYIATGAGQPKTWLNGMMDVNRASAAEMAEPARKHLASRQRYVRAMIDDIITFVCDQAELAGVLPKRDGIDPAPWAYTVQVPELATRDMAAAANSLNAAASAMATLRADRAIDRETMQEVTASLLGQLGVDVDLAAMRERIEQEIEEEGEVPYQTEPAMTGGLAARSGGTITNVERNQIAGMAPSGAAPAQNGMRP